MSKNLQSSCSQATAWIHSDNLVSYEFLKNRGVVHEDQLSPKLCTAVMEEIFKTVGISEGTYVDLDGENLTNLRFAEDVSKKQNKQKTKQKKQQQQQTNKWKTHLNNINLEVWKLA